MVQLMVPETVPIITDRLEGYRCELCGLIKYRPFTRGFFPVLTSQPTSHMIKTREYFGSGASAWQATLVSQQLAADLRKEKVRGVQFWPLAE